MDHRARIDALAREPITLVPHDPHWAKSYAEMEALLWSMAPEGLFTRIVHIGSTAIPHIPAKHIVDVQVEVTDLERVKVEVVPLLLAHGMEFIWRPTMGESAPFYAWFIRWDDHGNRTHHIHMVLPDQASVDRIRFRDALRRDPVLADRYAALKIRSAALYRDDRVAYTQGKSQFVAEVLAGWGG